MLNWRKSKQELKQACIVPFAESGRNVTIILYVLNKIIKTIQCLFYGIVHIFPAVENWY